MLLKELIERIDRSKSNEDWVSIEEVAQEVDLQCYIYCEQDRLKSYWITNWCCTDTWVGHKLYFLDDEAVAFSSQMARKSDENFKFIGDESAIKVRDYIITLMDEDEDSLCVETCSLDDEVGSTYSINYNSQLTSIHRATYKGEKVNIVETIRSEKKGYYISDDVKIKLKDNSEEIVKIGDIDFTFHLKDDTLDAKEDNKNG